MGKKSNRPPVPSMPRKIIRIRRYPRLSLGLHVSWHEYILTGGVICFCTNGIRTQVYAANRISAVGFSNNNKNCVWSLVIT